MSAQHEQHFRAVENLIYEWARAIDEDRVEAIAELLLPDGRYTVQSRFNHDRGLPMAIIDARSAAQLRDRIKSMRVANIYEPHHYRHILSGVQIVGEADGVLLRVSDTGPGIAEQLRERVFERFFRAAGAHQPGSGLGLSIVRRIAETHGASVQLAAGPDGTGLVVTVRFPAPADAPMHT